jgi:hypothetical protein
MNTQKGIYVSRWSFAKNHCMIHGQQNVKFCVNKSKIFLISNFRLCLNVVCFLLGNSPASEFFIRMFQNIYLQGKVLARKLSSQTFSRINTPTFSTTIIFHTYPLMKRAQTECSETLVYKIQTLGNYPEESIQQSKIYLSVHLLEHLHMNIHTQKWRYTLHIL